MPCIPLIEHGKRVGVICMAPRRVHLGRGIWMEYHRYFGPSFYPNETTNDDIDLWHQNPRIIAAWEKWQKENPQP